MRKRKDGTWVHRYLCVRPGNRHTFSVCFDEDAAPKFAGAKCPLKHRGTVIRWGTNNKSGAEHQRYKCTPLDKGVAAHTFTLELPRQRVPADPNWTDSDAVQNPNRGTLASGRGHAFTMEVVAEGLQKLAGGASYIEVGRWAAKQKAPRERKVARTKPVRGRNYWHTAAAWVELYSPILWNDWLNDLAQQQSKTAEGTLPRVLVLDDVPFYGGQKEPGSKHIPMLFSAIVGIEYYQANPAVPRYDHRVRLIRAYPMRTADAYELFVMECCDQLPDVILSDSAPAILTLVTRLRKYKPDLIWAPSAFHVVKQLRTALNKMTSPRLPQPLVPGDLRTRMESMSLLLSLAAWQQWWADLDQRVATQGVTPSALPTFWRNKYNHLIEDALTYLDAHPQVPRGNGALEAEIKAQVGPFFGGRAKVFTNIERVSRASDLLTLHLNDRLDSKAAIVRALTGDALDAGGYLPPARQVNDPEGFQSLRNRAVVAATLTQARKEAKARWGK